MVRVAPTPPSVVDLRARRVTTGGDAGRHRWHRWPARHHTTSRAGRRSILGTLVRLDDDPVLLCDCAQGAPHTCG